jgi:tetratricopeptide (TPR) repeat protein
MMGFAVRYARPALVIFLWIMVLGAGFCLDAPPAAAQSNSQIDAALRGMLDAYHSGRGAEAVPLAERHLAMVQRRYGENHAKYGNALFWMAQIYSGQGRYLEAEPIIKLAIANVERTAPPGDNEIGNYYSSLAHLYELTGRVEEAEPLYKATLAIFEKAPNATPTDIAVALNNLGLNYDLQDRTNEAEPLITARTCDVGASVAGWRLSNCGRIAQSGREPQKAGTVRRGRGPGQTRTGNRRENPHPRPRGRSGANRAWLDLWGARPPR